VGLRLKGQMSQRVGQTFSRFLVCGFFPFFASKDSLTLALKVGFMWHKKDNFCTLLWHWKRLFSPLFCCRFKFRPVFLLVLYGNWLPFEYFIIFNALSVYDYTWLVAGERIGDPNFLWKCFWNYLFNLRMELNFTTFWKENP